LNSVIAIDFYDAAESEVLNMSEAKDRACIVQNTLATDLSIALGFSVFPLVEPLKVKSNEK